jgi:hypothetical protein
MQNNNRIAPNEGTALRELSLDEAEAVGGRFGPIGTIIIGALGGGLGGATGAGIVAGWKKTGGTPWGMAEVNMLRPSRPGKAGVNMFARMAMLSRVFTDGGRVWWPSLTGAPPTFSDLAKFKRAQRVISGISVERTGCPAAHKHPPDNGRRTIHDQYHCYKFRDWQHFRDGNCSPRPPDQRLGRGGLNLRARKCCGGHGYYDYLQRDDY